MGVMLQPPVRRWSPHPASNPTEGLIITTFGRFLFACIRLRKHALSLSKRLSSRILTIKTPKKTSDLNFAQNERQVVAGKGRLPGLIKCFGKLMRLV